MEIVNVFSAILVLSALFAYINKRFINLPTTISLMIAGLVLSLIVQLIGVYSTSFKEEVSNALAQLDFPEFLLDFLLSFLLFAGAMHTNLEKLKSFKWPILSFATIGVLLSTVLIGTIFYYLLILFNYPLSFVNCLLFGALISPTDPIAVLGILKKAKAPESLEIKITGESLFNDGVGVVIFLTLYKVAQIGVNNLEITDVTHLLISEIVGGIGLGFFIGFIGYKMMKSIDHYQTEVIISLALVMGGYSLANYLHFSGPLAMVVAGLLIGNQGVEHAMSDITKDYVHKFWEMIDEILNSVLFLLIGLELLVLFGGDDYVTTNTVLIALLSIPLVLFARFSAVSVPMRFLGMFKRFTKGAIPVLTWGGVRGGISVALALSLPPFKNAAGEVVNGYFPIIILATYSVVVFSIIVQGLTIKRVVEKSVDPDLFDH